MSGDAVIPAAGVGALLAVLTFAILRAEAVDPDPAQIQPRDGLGQMLSQALAWLATVAAVMVILMTGGLIPAFLVAAAIAAGQRLNVADAALRPLFRYRLALAFAALLASALSLLLLLSSLEGATDV